MTRVTIGEALDLLAERDPTAVAVRADDGVLTRAELASASRAAARTLQSAGVRVDDLVTLRLPNSAAFVVAACAIWRAGATPQPLSARLPEDEQRIVIRTAGSRLVVGEGPQPDGDVRVVPSLGPEADDAPLPVLAAASWKAPASSGSTGLPKIVLATASAHVDPDRPAAPFLPLAARHLVAGPLTHSAPFTYAFRGLTTGHALSVLPRFDPAAVLDAIAADRITWALLVPTMLHRILRLHPEVRSAADLSSIEQIVHLGAPIAPAVKRAWLDWLGPERLTEVYAGSESNGLTMIRGDDWLRHPGSVGRPVSGSRMRVVLPDGAVAPVGALGRVQMRRDAGPASRYLGADSALDDGWDTLGDDGRIDADGYLFLADRGGDRITRAGTSFYPVELEQLLESHPLVRSAVAVGVPDDDLGQAVLVIADVADGGIETAGLLAWLRTRVDPEKRPDLLRIVHQPLRDDAGKVRRRSWADSERG